MQDSGEIEIEEMEDIHIGSLKDISPGEGMDDVEIGSREDISFGEEINDYPSVEDISLGDMDPIFHIPEVEAIPWLLGLNKVLSTCRMDKKGEDDIKKVLVYLKEQGWVPDGIPSTFEEPKVNVPSYMSFNIFD